MPYPPSHVGLIPDGMRRWATQTSSPLEESYLRGGAKLSELLPALAAEGVGEVTIFGMSRANLQRSPGELEVLYAACLVLLDDLLPKTLAGRDWEFHMVGERDLLPLACREAGERLESQHSSGRFRINLLAAYDPLKELQDAFERSRDEGIPFESALEVSDIDVLIRTSPEKLLSGFLPYQTRNALLHFSEVPLNDLSVDDFLRIVKTLSSIEPLRGR